jgi:putative flippase GtrA
VAAAAFAATQVTLFVLVLVHVSAGISGFIGAVFGAGVSYILSRWAWERKGRPAVLTETLPFWLVSLGAWLVLGLAAHYGGVWANSLGAVGVKRAAIIQGVYFVVNCFTFVARFLIFHYVLFADRGSTARANGSAARDTVPAEPSAVRATGAGDDDAVVEPGARR